MARQKRNMPSKFAIYNYWKDQGYKGKKYECMECDEDYGYVERCHITAKSDGAPDSVGNLVLCCHACHHLTDGRTKEQWSEKIIGSGIGSLIIGGIRFPSDYLLRNPDILRKIVNDAP